MCRSCSTGYMVHAGQIPACTDGAPGRKTRTTAWPASQIGDPSVRARNRLGAWSDFSSGAYNNDPPLSDRAWGPWGFEWRDYQVPSPLGAQTVSETLYRHLCTSVLHFRQQRNKIPKIVVRGLELCTSVHDRKSTDYT